MPPKKKCSKEEIVAHAYELVRTKGEEALTARNLALSLGTSTAPLFTAFKSIEEIQNAVKDKAKLTFMGYLEKGFQQTPAFKGTGLKYVQFAKDEPLLFRMLFMCADSNQQPSHYLPATFEPEERVRAAAQSSTGFDTERTKKLYNHLSVYVHGLAVLYAQGQCVFTDEDVNRMLSEVFMALTREDKP